MRYLRLAPYLEVKERIRSGLRNCRIRTEYIRADKALGRVAAEKLNSRCDIPLVSSTAMDGYALYSGKTRNASPTSPIYFRIRGKDSLDVRVHRLSSGPNETYYVATGSPLPIGADAVAKVEDTRLEAESIAVTRPIPKWEHFSPRRRCRERRFCNKQGRYLEFGRRRPIDFFRYQKGSRLQDSECRDSLYRERTCTVRRSE